MPRSISTPIRANAAISATSATSSASTSSPASGSIWTRRCACFASSRTKLSTGHLFDQGGKPLDPDPPFIDEDQRGLKVGYAKPYIIGYALAGLPDLIQFAPDEPDLKETVRAVADFLAAIG